MSQRSSPTRPTISGDRCPRRGRLAGRQAGRAVPRGRLASRSPRTRSPTAGRSRSTRTCPRPSPKPCSSTAAAPDAQLPPTPFRRKTMMPSANYQRRAGDPAISASRIDLQQYVVYLGFLAIFLFFAIVLKDSGFLTVRNLSNIVLQTAPVTVMAIGLVFVCRQARSTCRSAPPSRCRRSAAAVDDQRLRPGRRRARRPRRRPGDRTDQWRAGRLCQAAVLPGDAGDAWVFSPACRARMTDLRSIPVTERAPSPASSARAPSSAFRR